MKSKKRAKALAKKQNEKRARYARGGGKTRYAQKKNGSIQPTPRTARVWCAGCYRRMCGCDSSTYGTALSEPQPS